MSSAGGERGCMWRLNISPQSTGFRVGHCSLGLSRTEYYVKDYREYYIEYYRVLYRALYRAESYKKKFKN